MCNKTKKTPYKIMLLPGDGIGPEILKEAVKILESVGTKYDIAFEFSEEAIGGASIDLHGVPLRAETLQACKDSDAVLLGAVGGPKWDGLPKETRPETGLLGLRKGLGLYCNLRPVKLFPALKGASPLKQRDGDPPLDMLIVRELTGGIYFGERGIDEDHNGKYAWDQEKYSEREIHRIAEIAFEAAKDRKGLVTSVDKANVLESSRLWRDTVKTLHQDKHSEQVELNHQYVDNCAMQLILNPHQFDVVLTTNLFGDILSDEASMLTGSIGMLPSASLDANNKGLYEPSHGSAPDIAGKGVANPLATILSAAMMLRYTFNQEQAAQRVENAVKAVLAQGLRTGDIYEPGTNRVGTREMGDAVLAAL